MPVTKKKKKKNHLCDFLESLTANVFGGGEFGFLLNSTTDF